MPGAVGLEPADLTVAGARHRGNQLAVLVDDPQGRVVQVDRDGLAGVWEADLDALAGDLDATAAGDPPLDSLGLWREWCWPGEADALELMPPTGREGQGRVRHRMPPCVMTCMIWPSRRIRARCPASGEPT